MLLNGQSKHVDWSRSSDSSIDLWLIILIQFETEHCSLVGEQHELALHMFRSYERSTNVINVSDHVWMQLVASCWASVSWACCSSCWSYSSVSASSAYLLFVSSVLNFFLSFSVFLSPYSRFLLQTIRISFFACFAFFKCYSF